MSIEVTCPNGHELKLKDKYAGKSGRCPRCHVKMTVPKRQVESGISDEDAAAMIGEYEPPRPPKPVTPMEVKEETAADKSSHVLDDHPADRHDVGSGVSLIGSSIIHHKKSCTECGEVMDQWYASCKKCGHYFQD